MYSNKICNTRLKGLYQCTLMIILHGISPRPLGLPLGHFSCLSSLILFMAFLPPPTYCGNIMLLFRHMHVLPPKTTSCSLKGAMFFLSFFNYHVTHPKSHDSSTLQMIWLLKDVTLVVRISTIRG